MVLQEFASKTNGCFPRFSDVPTAALVILRRAGGSGALVLPVLITVLVLAGGFMLAAAAPAAAAVVVMVVSVSVGGHPVGLNHLAAATILYVDVLFGREKERGDEKGDIELLDGPAS